LYWRGQSERLPLLAILARWYLAIPATSASVESVFSLSNNIITKSRSSLDPTTTKQLVMLKSWQVRELKDLSLVDKEGQVDDETS
jgi:hypothetical protein